ncbi:MAG: trifunctional dihydropteroate synthetase [Cirrosporium novae-zelandiae]|nr:MAG: trifunctional dihydropteroate synthetase [Cirrosporium novae-zelandiae]
MFSTDSQRQYPPEASAAVVGWQQQENQQESSFWQEEDDWNDPNDTIAVNNLYFNTTVGPDAWGREKSQPITITLEFSCNLSKAAATDDVAHTISYGQIAKDITSGIKTDAPFPDIFTFTHAAAHYALDAHVHSFSERTEAAIVVGLPKGLLRPCAAFSYRREFCPAKSPFQILAHSISVSRLNATCIVGVNPHERLRKQVVLISLKLTLPVDSPQYTDAKFDSTKFNHVVDALGELVGASTYRTLEALATYAVHFLFSQSMVATAITVTAEKPSAVAAADTTAVTISRSRGWFEKTMAVREYR